MQIRASAPGMHDASLEPLDDTRIHPFNYPDANAMAKAVVGSVSAHSVLSPACLLTVLNVEFGCCVHVRRKKCGSELGAWI